jgi:hypothetical protein
MEFPGGDEKEMEYKPYYIDRAISEDLPCRKDNWLIGEM